MSTQDDSMHTELLQRVKADAVRVSSGSWLDTSETMWRTLTSWEKLQIEQAAAGCVSGTLREWPLLRLALISMGVPNTQNLWRTPSGELRDMCAAIMARVSND